MDGMLRNMTTIYLFRGDKVLLLFRQGGRVVNNVWTGSAGGHFECDELNDANENIIVEEFDDIFKAPDDVVIPLFALIAFVENVFIPENVLFDDIVFVPSFKTYLLSELVVVV